MKRLLTTMLITLAFSASALACGEDEPNQYFTGSGFNLTKANGVIVGTLERMPIWAIKACSSGISGQYKKGEEIQQFAIAPTPDKKVEGVFNGKKVILVGIDATRKEISLQSGEETILVTFTSEAFENGHHKQVTINFGNYSVHLDGEACMGSMAFYSVFLYGMTIL